MIWTTVSLIDESRTRQLGRKCEETYRRQRGDGALLSGAAHSKVEGADMTVTTSSTGCVSAQSRTRPGRTTAMPAQKGLL